MLINRLSRRVRSEVRKWIYRLPVGLTGSVLRWTFVGRVYLVFTTLALVKYPINIEFRRPAIKLRLNWACRCRYRINYQT